VRFGTQQQEAIKAIRKWLRDPNAPQVFRLFGWAGSGKTTLARHIEQIAQEIFNNERPTVYGAYTGKASMVLRSKGCTGATTIHSMIYTPIVDEATGRVTGYTRSRKSPIESAEYVTIDEVSMVNEEMGRDLESFGKKILVLGDPFQLPPIDGTGYFTEGEPDYMLTKVHRQAKDNPIIYMATEVRKGRTLEYGRYGDSRIIRTHKIDDEFYTGHDQIIVGRNVTRVDANRKIRSLLGRSGPLPMKGDRLICLKNDKEMGIVNGGMFDTLRLRSSDDKKFQIMVENLDEKDGDGNGIRLICDVLREQFEGDFNIVKNIEPKRLKGYQQFDFGNAITGHKGQGSQYGTVGLINEDYVFREMAQRWLYTCLTRAAERITMAGN